MANHSLVDWFYFSPRQNDQMNPENYSLHYTSISQVYLTPVDEPPSDGSFEKAGASVAGQYAVVLAGTCVSAHDASQASALVGGGGKEKIKLKLKLYGDKFCSPVLLILTDFTHYRFYLKRHAICLVFFSAMSRQRLNCRKGNFLGSSNADCG